MLKRARGCTHEQENDESKFFNISCILGLNLNKQERPFCSSLGILPNSPFLIGVFSAVESLAGAAQPLWLDAAPFLFLNSSSSLNEDATKLVEA
jgi:hypothetical protein